MKINRIDHIGVVVRDISEVKEFFLAMGLEVVGEQDLEGEWVGRVIGLENVKSSIVMMRTPDGGMNIELSQFYAPLDEKGSQPTFANTLGIRHICFVVDDIEDMVAKVKEKGAEPFGEIQNYKNMYKLCYIRGPEGIILELAEEVK
jgi:catechol 2,3-dioxygenase-like lactoylglutathione lyase family enzyme